uniref:Uncharacterized protein n=1 Tax=Arundo donax TaxID=35708 RepID=A0A0A9A7M3_ARUDO
MAPLCFLYKIPTMADYSD